MNAPFALVDGAMSRWRMTCSSEVVQLKWWWAPWLGALGPPLSARPLRAVTGGRGKQVNSNNNSHAPRLSSISHSHVSQSLEEFIESLFVTLETICANVGRHSACCLCSQLRTLSDKTTQRQIASESATTASAGPETRVERL